MTPERRASLHAEADSLANIGMGGVAASIVEALNALDAAEADAARLEKDLSDLYGVFLEGGYAEDEDLPLLERIEADINLHDERVKGERE